MEADVLALPRQCVFARYCLGHPHPSPVPDAGSIAPTRSFLELGADLARLHILPPPLRSLVWESHVTQTRLMSLLVPNLATREETQPRGAMP